MKNWFKCYEHPECDILMKKSYSDDDNSPELTITIYDDNEGLSLTQKIGFNDIETRDKAYEEIPAEKVHGIANGLLGILKYAKNPK